MSGLHGGGVIVYTGAGRLPEETQLNAAGRNPALPVCSIQGSQGQTGSSACCSMVHHQSSVAWPELPRLQEMAFLWPVDSSTRKEFRQVCSGHSPAKALMLHSPHHAPCPMHT